MTTIGYSSFYNCTRLTSVTIPSSVTSVGNSAFSNCSSLTTVTIPSSMTTIGYAMFYNCTRLTSITIASSVTSIDDAAFRSCSSLTSITIPSSVTSIGNLAFYDCNNLTFVTIPSSVTNIGDSAFEGCSSLTSVIFPINVTSIGTSVFRNCNSLTSATILSSVANIGGCMFYDCISLTSITIPSSVTSIGNFAFFGCISLTSVSIPNSVTSIGSYSFYGCSSLAFVVIPNSVISIGSVAFKNCSSLTFVTIPNSVTSIGNSAFVNCISLTSVTIPNSVTSIGSSTFCYCSSLTSVTIPSSVTTIDTGAFSNCSSLVSITIPSSVKTIGFYAFYDCSSLTSITIPSSVTSIDLRAFDSCNKAKLVIHCKAGSTAETYARNNGYMYDKFSILEPNSKVSYVPVNTSNKVTEYISESESYTENQYWDGKNLTITTAGEVNCHKSLELKNCNIVVDGNLKVEGKLTVTKGCTITINGKVIATDILVEDDGRIIIDNNDSKIDVKSDFNIESDHDKNKFIKGQLYIGGNFNQVNGKDSYWFNDSKKNFRPGKDFEVIFYQGGFNERNTEIKFASKDSYFYNVIYDNNWVEKITYSGTKNIRGKEYLATVLVTPKKITFYETQPYSQSYSNQMTKDDVQKELLQDYIVACYNSAESSASLFDDSVLESLFVKKNAHDKTIYANQLKETIKACLTVNTITDYSDIAKSILQSFSVKVGGQKIYVTVSGFSGFGNSYTFENIMVKTSENTAPSSCAVFSSSNMKKFQDSLTRYSKSEVESMINSVYSGVTGEKVIKIITSWLVDKHFELTTKVIYGANSAKTYSLNSNNNLLTNEGVQSNITNSLLGIENNSEDGSFSISDIALENSIREQLNLEQDVSLTVEMMESLVRLNINNKGITDLSGLQYAINLTDLDISGNEILNLSPIENMRNLSVLNVSQIGNANFSIIGNFTGLKSLDISNNGLSDIRFISGLVNLEELYARNAGISNADVLQHLPLKIVNLANNGLTSFSSDSSALLTLNLRNNLIEEINVSLCSELSELNIDNNQLSDEDAVTLSDNTKLLCLNIGNNQIENITWLQQLVNIEVLNLNGLYLIDSDISVLKYLNKVYSLVLSANCIADLEDVCTIPTLALLDISNTQVIDLTPVSQLTNLEILVIDDLLYLDDSSKTLIGNMIRNGIAVEQKDNDTEIKTIMLSHNSIILEKNSTYTLIATIYPMYLENNNLVWSSSNETVCAVDNGVVTAISQGTSIITVKSENGVVLDTCEFEVILENENISNVVINNNSISATVIGSIGIGEQTAKIIVVSYYGNGISELVSHDVNITESGIKETFEFSDLSDCTQIKIFVWDDFSHLIPLYQSKTVLIK